MNVTIGPSKNAGIFKQIKARYVVAIGSAVLVLATGIGLYAAGATTASSPVLRSSPLASYRFNGPRPVILFYLVASPAQETRAADLESSAGLEAAWAGGTTPDHTFKVLQARTPDEEQHAFELAAAAAGESDDGPIVKLIDLRGK